MARGGLAHGLAAALLGAGAVVLLLYRDRAGIDPWYLSLLVGGTAGVSFCVGYVLGYLTEGGMGSSPRDRN